MPEKTLRSIKIRTSTFQEVEVSGCCGAAQYFLHTAPGFYSGLTAKRGRTLEQYTAEELARQFSGD